MISLGLLEAGMRYREAYFRDDIKDYTVMCQDECDKAVKLYKDKNHSDKGLAKRLQSRTDLTVQKFKNEQEAFNRTVYSHINRVVDRMPEITQVGFDNFATGFGLLLEEFLKAKNTTDLLTLARGYNMGLLDSVLEILNRTNEKTETTDAVDSVNTGVVPEGEQPAANEPIITADAGHESVGPVQDGSVQPIDRVVDEPYTDSPL